MGPFDPLLVIFGGSVAFMALIFHFNLRKKELEVREREIELRGSDAELGPVVDALRDDLADMEEHTRTELAEMRERLDVTERMLAAGRASQEDRSG